MGGVVISSAENRKKLNDLNRLVGGALGPFEAWLALRGCKTLPLRVREQCANAARIAEWLTEHPKIERVNYPGLPNHPQHELAQKLFPPGFYGGMISFEVKDAAKEEIFRFMEALELIIPATTLGDVYSLVLYPPMSSHRALSPEERAKVGISDRLVRLSVGIEEAAEIIGDLERALEKSR
jgi:cystathionine gamma-synthase/methionine-gamma-lyase